MAMNYNNPMELLKFNLKRQNEQGEAIVQIVDYMENMRIEVKKDIQELRDSITLNYAEQYEIQSKVHTISVEFAKLICEDEWNEMVWKEKSKVIGKYRRAIWKIVKTKFNVARYPLITRKDFQKALAFVNELRIRDLEIW